MRPASRGIGQYRTPLDVRILPCPPEAADPNYVRIATLADFEYWTCDGKHLIVPRGFHSDGASIPPQAQLFVGHPLSSQNAFFGLVHDMLYRLGGYFKSPSGWPVDWPTAGNFAALDKDACDMYAYDMALCSGHTAATAESIYLALREFGHGAWDENAKKRQQSKSFVQLMEWA